MNPEEPSEDRPPREKRGIEPFKPLLEFFRTHPFRNKCDMLHIIEIPSIRQYPLLFSLRIGIATRIKTSDTSARAESGPNSRAGYEVAIGPSFSNNQELESMQRHNQNDST
jgi:hypothetical protein